MGALFGFGPATQRPSRGLDDTIAAIDRGARSIVESASSSG
jgi:hypothetical protein